MIRKPTHQASGRTGVAIPRHIPLRGSNGATHHVHRAERIGEQKWWDTQVVHIVASPFSRRKTMVIAPRGSTAVDQIFARKRLAVGLRRVTVVPGDGIGGDTPQLVDHIQCHAPDEVYVVLDGVVDEQEITRIGATLLMDGIAFHLVLPDHGRPPVHAHSSFIGTTHLISLRPLRGGIVAGAIRRVVDVIGAGLLLILLAPVLLAVALLVWWKMGWPVMHKHERIGQGGKLFSIYKFRSMVVDADQLLRRSPELYRRYVESDFKIPADQDERVTPLGRVLRTTSLDELPQLWNVLRGDMTLVGPRAVVPEELARYGEYANMLLRSKPGLTGLWQVSGRSTITYPERARMDLRYIGGRSFANDLEILLRTVPAVLRQRGAL